MHSREKRIGIEWMILIGLFFIAGCAPNRTGAVADPLTGLVRLYQGPLDHLSMVRRGTTSMYPSSSDYSLEAVSKHGPVIGWWMTCDRLVRSGRDEMRLSEEIERNGRRFAFDPVSANDFWWSRQE